LEDGEEGAGGLVVSGGYAPELLQAPDHALDPVPLPIKGTVQCPALLSVALERDDWVHIREEQVLTTSVCIIAFVGQQAPEQPVPMLPRVRPHPWCRGPRLQSARRPAGVLWHRPGRGPWSRAHPESARGPDRRPLFCTRRLRVSANNGGVDHLHAFFRQCASDGLKQGLKHARLAPAAETAIDAVPAAISVRPLRTVLRETFSSRTISLIDLPLTKSSRRMRAIVSTTSISRPTRSSLGAGSFAHTPEGSKLGSDAILVQGSIRSLR
jgi:hypothetical protein